MHVIVVPVTSPISRGELSPHNHLAQLQDLVGGGNIEAIYNAPGLTDGSTAYCNEESYRLPEHDQQPNSRANDILGGMYALTRAIVGPVVFIGFDPRTGQHLPTLPNSLTKRIELVEAEAA